MKNYPCRALLDSGSQSNFLSEHIVNKLRLKRELVQIPIVGINGEKLTVTHQTASRVKSVHREKSWVLEFLVVPQVTGILPANKLDIYHWKIPAELPLADPRFNIPAKVDMLIGAELFFELLLTERLRTVNNQPMLWSTELGWIICGSYSSIQRPVVVSAVAHYHASESDLHSAVQKFWEQEEIPETSNLSAENQQCLDHFSDTHRREEGRYIVRLPFRDSVDQLGSSRSMAEKRFLQLEKRLSLHLDLKALYTAFVKEYITLGHCEKIEDEKDNNNRCFYLPHHAILKPSSTSTKLRVVFDASARSDTNLSLNDVLHAGPVVQDNLMAIVLRFRTYRYVFTADIIKMYRQVRVDSRDTPYQRVLWRENPRAKLTTYELKTVTYGTSCAPFCATACLKQLADDEEEEFPIAARVVRKDFYIDDVLTGADDLLDALKCQSQLIAMLKRGGFDLHKWCANAPQLLQKIPKNDRETQAKIEDHESNDVIKTLGLLWDPSNDIFLFSLRSDKEPRIFYTKRIVLSETAKIFDPFGLLEPITILAKLFIQALWALSMDWDEALPAELDVKWRQFKDDLRHINELTIPRRVIAEGVVAYEIHGFSDASKKAYGACVYLRSIKSDRTAEMHLLSSKTRVAPLPKKPESKKHRKPFTIPRAELCGAHLLAKLVNSVIDYLDLKINLVVLWCDSQIVLCWLAKSPASLEIFVGNKVREINQLTNQFEWRYINTKENPADLVSRGVAASDLQRAHIWWHGPSLLHVANYPYNQIEPATFTDQELELRVSAYSHVSIQHEQCELLTKYSDFRRLQRTVACLHRFVYNCRTKNKLLRRTGPLTISELRFATSRIIAQTQREGFAEEFQMLENNRIKKSKLLRLAPFIDSDGLLRVGGRLKHANIPFGKKHQLLLPTGHHVTKILIAALHREHLHVGQHGLLAIVRQRYWPVRGKDATRQVVKKCIRCFRMNPPEAIQFMGMLPDYRVNPSPVFSKTGIDYAGPFYIRQGVRGVARVKAYVALFICMSTKAIHLEVVSDLTTEAFLAALQRFIGRRGLPEQLHTDNATNFRGAQSELHELFKLFQCQQATNTINQFCVAKEIQWSFIPPRSPNFGGIWEAGVKSAKRLLKRVLCEASLNFEELTTVMVQIEVVLNSRPLTELSSDPNDLSALTPGHFLVGRELTAPPEPSYGDVRVSRWQHLQKQKQDFWARWSSEYLCELQPRGKWYKSKLVIRPGMLVVLREDNMPPQQWRLGHITQVHPGPDDLVRVVTVKTENAVVKRAISKIAVLPVE